LTATLPHWDALLKRVFSAMSAEFAALATLVFVPVGTVFWPAGWAFLALFFGFQPALVLCLRIAGTSLCSQRDGKGDGAK